MADDDGRAGIDRRLRELARDAEPLVVLAGPAAARGRGERRRSRRTGGVLALVAAVVLAAGSWQLVPRLAGNGHGGTATTPAATVPAPDPLTLVQRLRARLPSVAAMPLYPSYPWRVVPEGSSAKFEEPCPVGALEAAAAARASRVYADAKRQFTAFVHLYAYADDAHAVAAVARFEQAGRNTCWPDGLKDGPAGRGGGIGAGLPAGPVADAYGTSADGRTSVLVERRGRYAAVLFLSDASPARHAMKGVPGVGGAPAVCLARALSGLDAEMAAATPSVPSPDPHGTTAGQDGGPSC